MAVHITSKGVLWTTLHFIPIPTEVLVNLLKGTMKIVPNHPSLRAYFARQSGFQNLHDICHLSILQSSKMVA